MSLGSSINIITFYTSAFSPCLYYTINALLFHSIYIAQVWNCMVQSITDFYCVSSCNLYLAITVTLRLLYICINLLQNPSQLKNMYFILLFLVVKLLALYFIKYNLNYLSICLIRNSPAYTTWSATIGNFTPLCLIFSFIQVKNPLSLAFLPLNLLINGIFTLVIPISLILFSNTYPLLVS